MAQSMMRHGMAQARPVSRSAAVMRPVRTSGVSRRQVTVQAFFNFLKPTAAAPKVDPRAAELVDALVDIASQTDAGAKASASTKEEINELVDELSQYCIKNPLRSPLLWGVYKVLYASKASAVGGPLKKGAGPVLFPGQVARQRLEEPNILVNEVDFKALGFLPGGSRQYGQIQPISGDTFILKIDRGELSTGFGPTQEREFDITRKIQIVYLDETLRVARFLPDESLADSEAAEEGNGATQAEAEEILFVFKRIAEAEEEEEEEAVVEEEEEEEEAAPALPALPLFGGTRRTEGLATRAERQVRQQMRAEGSDEEEEAPKPRRGTVIFGARRPASPAEEKPAPQAPRSRAEMLKAAADRQQQQQQTRSGSRAGNGSGTRPVAVGPSREELAKQRAAEREAAEQRKREEAEARRRAEIEARQKAEEEKKRAAQEARERAEAEKAAARERQEAIRALLAELQEDLADKAAASKEATTELRVLQREQGPILKQVAVARKRLEEAEQEVTGVAQELAAANGARKLAEDALKAAQAELRGAEAEFKRRVASALPSRK